MAKHAAPVVEPTTSPIPVSGPQPLTRAERRKDARERASRTLWQGFLVDVLAAAAAAALIVLGAMDDDELLTRSGITVLGTAIVKSVLTAAASWVTRYASPPSTE